MTPPLPHGSGGTPSEETYAFPASFAQEQIYFVRGLAGDAPVYHEAFAFDLDGSLDPALLRQAFELVSARHEALRTMIDLQGDAPRQLVLAETSLDLRLEQGAFESDTARDAWLTARASAPFALEQAPPFRVVLRRIGDSHHLLLVVTHHAVCDGHALGLVLGEASAAYRALAAGESPALPAVGLQYPDFAAWQRDMVSQGANADSLSYWRDALAGVDAALPLPSDRPRPAVQAYVGQTATRQLPADLMERLTRAQGQLGATRFHLLLAAYAVLLARYALVDDVPIGVPMSLRDVDDAESAIGDYVNAVVCRIRPTPTLSYRALVAQVREVSAQALAHRAVPFSHVVEAVQSHRAGAFNPLFQAMFSLGDDPVDRLVLPDVAVRRLPVSIGGARADLWFNVLEGRTGGCLHVEYDKALFDATSIESMIDAFATLLEEALSSPDTEVGDVPMLRPTDLQRLSGWGSPAVELAHDDSGPLPKMLERIVVEHGDAVAVEALDGTRVTYGAFDAGSRGLAGRLRQEGIGRGDLVAVLLERSELLPLALLGVLRAGAAYMPLDPSTPTARMLLKFEDARPSAVIVSPSLVSRLPQGSARLIELDRDTPLAASTAPDAPVTPDDLAYVIFTSGSTGRPKGVEVTHGGFANLLASFRTQPGFGATDRMLAITTAGFDISGLELFLPLVSGGTTVIADTETSRDPMALIQVLDAHAISWLQATPATWRMLLDAGWAGKHDLLALVGGEALAPDLARALAARTARAWNVYGPTETTIWSTMWRIEADAPFVSIGRPIANTRTHVVDGRGRPVPECVPGEVVIGGAGVARGYRARPDLSSERFVQEPLAGPGTRAYRTGDLGRWRGGLLEHLGRLDDQVKIRGFRIELGEVEAALLQVPNVAAAAVAVRKDPLGERVLIAYVVPCDGEIVTTTEARRFLRTRLPDYMIPSHFVALERLPTTASGKLDRRALPDPLQAAHFARAHRPPELPMQKLVAEIWREVIGHGEPGLDDNFFDLGGHSLGALRVLGRLAERGGPRLSPQVLIRETLEHVAAAASR
jgi:amino acid adenylation domain-containing protein